MDVIPTHGKSTQSRTKAQSKDATTKPVRKTLTTRRKKLLPSVELIATTPDVPLDLNGLVATTAFYLAADRNFEPGHELDDWLEAERRVRAQHPA